LASPNIPPIHTINRRYRVSYQNDNDEPEQVENLVTDKPGETQLPDAKPEAPQVPQQQQSVPEEGTTEED
jgi:hypothetical protein